MARTLIAFLASPTGRYPAKVNSYSPGTDIQPHFFILGKRQDCADMQTGPWAKTMHETARSPQVADKLGAEARALTH